MKRTLGILLLAAAPAARSELSVGFSYSSRLPDYYESAPIAVQYSDVDDVSFFYDQLAPYGSWVNVPAYGMCWQPSVVRSDPYWQPYLGGGRWKWTNLGWYWDSAYPWGWAAFHYGRWVQLSDVGWVWVPDTVWGPAWVSWRYDDSYYGWAPLPPGYDYYKGKGFRHHDEFVDYKHGWDLDGDRYVFVPRDHFGDRDMKPYALDRERRKEIYKHSAAPDRPYDYSGDYIVNRGPSTEWMKMKQGRYPATANLMMEKHKGDGYEARGFKYDRGVDAPIVNQKPSSRYGNYNGGFATRGDDSKPNWSRSRTDNRSSSGPNFNDAKPNAVVIPHESGRVRMPNQQPMPNSGGEQRINVRRSETPAPNFSRPPPGPPTVNLPANSVRTMPNQPSDGDRKSDPPAGWEKDSRHPNR
jgi:hypothetical protein